MGVFTKEKELLPVPRVGDRFTKDGNLFEVRACDCPARSCGAHAWRYDIILTKWIFAGFVAYNARSGWTDRYELRGQEDALLEEEKPLETKPSRIQRIMRDREKR